MSTLPNENNPQWRGQDMSPGRSGEAEDPYGSLEQARDTKFRTSGYDSGRAYDVAPEEPRRYSLLKTMTLASFGLFLLFTILSAVPLVTGQAEDAARAELEGIDLGGASVDDAVARGMMFAWAVVIVPLVVGAVLYPLVYGALKKVRGWGRTTGIVTAFLGLIFMLIFGVLSSIGMGGLIVVATLFVSLAWVAVVLFWLVLAFSATVRDYLAQSGPV